MVPLARIGMMMTMIQMIGVINIFLSIKFYTMSSKTKAQLKTEKDTFTDGGGATTSMFRNQQESLIDSLNARYQSAIDCSANPNYPASDAGMIYSISVSGRIGGSAGKVVTAGDLLLCVTDSIGGTESGHGTKFIHINNQIKHAVKKDETEADLFASFKSALVVLETDLIDLTATATDVEISIPSGFHFYPIEVGIIIVGPATAIANPPSIRFGEGAGSEATLIAATAITGTNALHERKRFTSLLHDNGVTKLSCGVTAAGTGTAYNGRAYFIGHIQQDQ